MVALLQPEGSGICCGDGMLRDVLLPSTSWCDRLVIHLVRPYLSIWPFTVELRLGTFPFHAVNGPGVADLPSLLARLPRCSAHLSWEWAVAGWGSWELRTRHHMQLETKLHSLRSHRLQVKLAP